LIPCNVLPLFNALPVVAVCEDSWLANVDRVAGVIALLGGVTYPCDLLRPLTGFDTWCCVLVAVVVSVVVATVRDDLRGWSCDGVLRKAGGAVTRRTEVKKLNIQSCNNSS
jgi:hypothetical protein